MWDSDSDAIAEQSDLTFSDASLSDNEASDREDVEDQEDSVAHLLTTAFTDARYGTFAGMGTLDTLVSPGLEIQGIGMIGLPLSEQDAQRIISAAEMAPFGKGVETKVDHDVRKTYQVSAQDIKFANPAWSTSLNATAVSQACQILGVERQYVQAHLHKLLLYREGHHFVSHSDTEKEPNHFATLVVILPSRFEGGSVTVRHDGATKTFDLASVTTFSAAFTALYTDVEHQVDPVTSGNRLALSYNLVYTQPSIPRPVLSSPALEQLKQELQTLAANPDTLVAHVLSHQYSEIGLSFDAIKGQDRGKVQWLVNIAKELGLCIHLAQVSVARTSPNAEYDDGSKPKIKITLPAVVGLRGPDLTLQTLKLNKDDFHPHIKAKREGHDKMEDGGYLGNEASNDKQWYYRTAVLLWSSSHDITVRFEKSQRSGSQAYLTQTVATFRNQGDATSRKHLEEIVSIMSLKDFKCSTDLLEAIALLRDADFMHKTMENLKEHLFLGELKPPNLLPLIEAYGFPAVQPYFAFLLERDNPLLPKQHQRSYGQIGGIYARVVIVNTVSNLHSWRSMVADAHAGWLKQNTAIWELIGLRENQETVPKAINTARETGAATFRKSYLDLVTESAHSLYLSDLALGFAESDLKEEYKDWCIETSEKEAKKWVLPRSIDKLDIQLFVNLVKVGFSFERLDIITSLLDKIQPPADRKELFQYISNNVVPIVDQLRLQIPKEPLLSWFSVWARMLPDTQHVPAETTYQTVHVEELDEFLRDVNRLEYRDRVRYIIQRNISDALDEIQKKGLIKWSCDRYCGEPYMKITKLGSDAVNAKNYHQAAAIREKFGEDLMSLVKAENAGVEDENAEMSIAE